MYVCIVYTGLRLRLGLEKARFGSPFALVCVAGSGFTVPGFRVFAVGCEDLHRNLQFRR